MGILAKSYYDSGHRMEKRAYIKEGQFFLPVKNEDGASIKNQFFNNISNHIEISLERNYADYIFFSDMGHSHLLLPIDFYKNKIYTMPTKPRSKRIEILLGNPNIKILYHTAEQLKLKDENKELLTDRKMMWRFFSRNVIGDNKNGKNTSFKSC